MAASTKIAKGVGTRSSVVVDRCQDVRLRHLKTVHFFGYHPPVNEFHPIGAKPKEQPSYPSSLLLCESCELVQLSLVVDPAILFPPSYPYTSGTTRILRENFANLYKEVMSRPTACLY